MEAVGNGNHVLGRAYMRNYPTRTITFGGLAVGIPPSSLTCVDRNGFGFSTGGMLHVRQGLFWGTLKTECVYRHTFRTRAEAKNVIFAYLEAFYNRQRLHSTLGYLSPEKFERAHATS